MYWRTATMRARKVNAVCSTAVMVLMESIEVAELKESGLGLETDCK